MVTRGTLKRAALAFFFSSSAASSSCTGRLYQKQSWCFPRPVNELVVAPVIRTSDAAFWEEIGLLAFLLSPAASPTIPNLSDDTSISIYQLQDTTGRVQSKILEGLVSPLGSQCFLVFWVVQRHSKASSTSLAFLYLSYIAVFQRNLSWLCCFICCYSFRGLHKELDIESLLE